MKDIKFSIFDLFSYSLPGGVTLIAFWLIHPKIENIAQLGSEISEIKIGLGIVLIFVTYIVGNAVDSVGSWIFYKIGVKIWGSTHDAKNDLPVGEQRALIRNYSPENQIYIQQWKVVKTMSHNLSFSFLLLGIVMTIKVIMNENSREAGSIILIIISFLFSMIFLNRAHIFDRWHYKDLTSIVKSLHLTERAEKDSEINKKEERNGELA